jgi:hypothetical protein
MRTSKCTWTSSLGWAQEAESKKTARIRAGVRAGPSVRRGRRPPLVRPLADEPNSSKTRDHYCTADGATGEPQGGVGKTECQSLRRKSELTSRPLERDASDRRPIFHPQRARLPSRPDVYTGGVDGEYQYLTTSDGHDTRSPVCRHEVIGLRLYLDVIQRSGKARKSNSEQQAGDCNDQHQFDEAKPLSHGSG